MSDPFDYQNILPLIDDSEVRGRTAMFVFHCPVSGHRVRARFMKPLESSAASKVAAQARRSAWNEAQRGVLGMLRSVLGTGAASRVAQQAAGSAMRSAGQAMGSDSFSSEEKEDAAVGAFRSVSNQFTWTGDRWMSNRAAAELMSDFERQMASHPIQSEYDRQVLARMLVEVAAADGQFEEAEQDMLADVLDSDAGSLQSLRERPPLTEAELSETTPGGVRQSLLMMAAVLALCDEDFDRAEQKRLQDFASGMALGKLQVQDVMNKARFFVLDQALDRMLTWGGHDQHARDAALELAGKIGLSPKQAEAAEARYLKRQGEGLSGPAFGPRH